MIFKVLHEAWLSLGRYFCALFSRQNQNRLLALDLLKKPLTWSLCTSTPFARRVVPGAWFQAASPQQPRRRLRAFISPGSRPLSHQSLSLQPPICLGGYRVALTIDNGHWKRLNCHVSFMALLVAFAFAVTQAPLQQFLVGFQIPCAPWSANKKELFLKFKPWKWLILI